MTYIFKCENCNSEQERELRMSDYDKEKDNQYCVCGAKMTRVFTPIGLTLYKCGGFYDTDTRKIGGR